MFLFFYGQCLHSTEYDNLKFNKSSTYIEFVSISAMSRSKEICIIRKKRENGIKITAREDGVSVFVWFRKVKRVGVGVCA